MREEKMMILQMLQEGKITPDEAVKLIEAIDDINYDSINQNESSDEKANRLSTKTFEEIGSDISNAFSNLLSGLKDIGSNIVINKNYETIDKFLEKDISMIENPIIDLRAVNGSIRVRKSDSDKLLINVHCQYKNGLLDNNKEFYKFYEDGSKVVFSPIYNNDISIKLDVSLPAKRYQEILINSTNGKLDIGMLNLDTISCITTNGAIELFQVDAKDMNLSTKNGKIQCLDSNSDIIKAATTNSSINLINVSSFDIDAYTANSRINLKNVKSERINAKTSNGTLEVMDISSKIIHLNTSNAKIICDKIDMDKASNIILNSSNGSINADLNNITKDAYFDLETSMGNINLDLPYLIYKINKQVNLGVKRIVAHSVTFEESKDHLKIIASTSNGSIKIY